MGKRDKTEIKTPPVELKRSKRKKHYKYAKPDTPVYMTSPTKSDTPNEIIVDESEISIQQEEEVVCVEEVEISTNEEVVENIDVETADNEDLSIQTPTIKTNKPLNKNKSNKKNIDKNQTANNSNIKEDERNVITPTQSPSTSAANTKKSKRRRDSGTSSDEERWLTAIESGKLEDVDDELKKIKDPKLMTARQRAMYERNSDREATLPGGEMLMSLPIGYREREKPQTAEDIQKAVLQSQRRKQQANEKREKDKKRTMDRLLKKQESKQRSSKQSKQQKNLVPMIKYVNNAEGALLIMPPEFEFPLKPLTPIDPPQVKLCGIPGCGKPKKYNCSKTNKPLCSFECYKKNVQSAKMIMC